MLLPRVHRLDALLERVHRPGGMYPVFWLASQALSDEEREVMDARITVSSLGPLWKIWRDPSVTVADKAFALVEFDPVYAVVHLLVADLFLRDDDAYAEPFPEIRQRLSALRLPLALSYSSVLSALKEQFASDAECHSLHRGFGYSAGKAMEVLTVPEERECFARACRAWHREGGVVENALPVWERVEHRLKHQAAGVRGYFREGELTALECPAMLTAIEMGMPALEADLSALASCERLQSLQLGGEQKQENTVLNAVMETLSITTLDLRWSATSPVLLPSWILSLSSLQQLWLDYSNKGVDSGAVALPESLGALERLERLSVSGAGSLPASIERLQSLRSLSVRGWSFVGLPAAITKLTSLEELRVDPVLKLPDVPEGFERMTGLRTLRLGHLTTTEPPKALFSMPWLRRIELISARKWKKEHVDALKQAFPNAYVSVGFTGNAV